jgi:hypothetical protein
MELTTFQRFLTFAAAVVVLGGIGVYLFLPNASGTSRSPASGKPSASAGGPSTAAPGPPAGSASPGGSATPAGPAPDIYQWLPFTAASLGRAASVAVVFGKAYGSYSYRQSTTAYLAPMRGLMTTQLAQVIGRAYAAPGVAQARIRQRQVAAGTAVISALRAFGPTSITFALIINQRLTTAKGSGTQSSSYAVTLTSVGAGWQVSDVELASAGNL